MFTFYFIIRLKRLHLKIRVQVAVLTKFYTKKTNSIIEELVFLSIMNRTISRILRNLILYN